MNDEMVRSKHKTKIAFTTLGCRVNQYDTQVMKEQVEKVSLQSVGFEEVADIYVINTCTVTSGADSEGRQLIRRAKAKNPNSFVVVTGCLAQDRPEHVAGLPGVDMVVGNSEKSALLHKIVSQYEPLQSLSDEIHRDELSPWGGGISRFDAHQRATIKVQEGCQFGCSFCLIPRVRGKMISRPEADIIEEGKRLAAHGIQELVLAGIQLSSYGRDEGIPAEEPRLAPVIEKLLRIPGIHRVRLSSYAVADFEDALLPLWKSLDGFCAHLHLPLQSGDPGILKSMRRPYTLENYQSTVQKIRNFAPKVGLTSDVIAGFPGESDQAFENTLSVIKKLNFVDFHPFPYSDRPQTHGESLFPKVNPSVKRQRMNRLWQLKRECLEISARKAKGNQYRVIVERYNAGQQAGLTDEGLRVVFPEMPGFLGKEIIVQVEGFREGHAWASVLTQSQGAGE